MTIISYWGAVSRIGASTWPSRLAGPTVRFLGRVPDGERRRLLSRCRAFLWPGEEDFGLAPLEANASGRPVIAYAGGGALETVEEGRTGAFFRAATAEALAEALQRFDPDAYDPAALRRHALRFDVTRFEDELRMYVAAVMGGLELPQRGVEHGNGSTA